MANKHNCPCLAKAGDEETIFTLLASDPDAPAAVELWAHLREMRLGRSAKTVEARKTAAKMREERTEMELLNRTPSGQIIDSQREPYTLAPVPQPRMSPEPAPKSTPKFMPLQTDSLPKPLRADCPRRIPWLSIAPYQAQAQRNHWQSLEQLAERGGLSPEEAYAVMHNIPWSREIPAAEAVAFIRQIVNGPDGGVYAAGAEERAAAHGGGVFVDKRRDHGAGGETT